MKKNKLWLLLFIAIAIILVQPSVRTKLLTMFDFQDVPAQLGVRASGSKVSGPTKVEKSDDEIITDLSKTQYVENKMVILVQNNKATFSVEDLSLEKGFWESHQSLDSLNRVGEANAMLDKANMPTAERENIANIKPTGWHNKKIVFNGHSDYLYNRSHLIGYQLTGGNADAKNLFTGTRALNANFADDMNSMVGYEDEVANYLRQHPTAHVRYQVTPVFKGIELVARGVRMQAESVEDKGVGLNFDVYIFNVQPNYKIHYLTGMSTKE